MKLNADERGAFLALQSIIDFYTKEEQDKKEYLQLTTREYRLIKKVFGIDLKEVTYRKKDVREFARGKDKKHIEFLNPYSQLTTREYRLIKKVFGIDLKEVTYRKKDVREFARGKDKKHIEFLNPYSPSAYENKVVKYGYFPFQVKKVNEEEQK